MLHNCAIFMISFYAINTLQKTSILHPECNNKVLNYILSVGAILSDARHAVNSGRSARALAIGRAQHQGLPDEPEQLKSE